MTAVTDAFRPIEYVQPNFRLTGKVCEWASDQSKKVLLCALPIIALVVVFELVIKNPAILALDVTIALANAARYLVYRARKLCVSRAMRSPTISSTPPTTIRGLGARNTHRGAHRPIRSEVPRTPSVVEPPLANQPFTGDELATFRAAIRSHTNELRRRHNNQMPNDVPDLPIVQIGDILYAVWYDETTRSIQIHNSVDYYARRNENLLSLTIDEAGLITRVRLNNREQLNEVPENWRPVIHQCFLKCLELSSLYSAASGTIEIQVIRRGLKDVTPFHLEKLAELIRANPRARLHVVFLKNNMEREVGADAGGLSRDYVDDLGGNFTKDPNLSFVEDPTTHLLMPKPRLPYTEGSARLSFEEAKMYKEMGQLMMYCYCNGGVAIGQRFAQGLFSAALSLTPEEIFGFPTPLTEVTKLKMCERIVRGNGLDPSAVRAIQLVQQRRQTNADMAELVQFLNNLGNDFQNPTNETERANIRREVIQYFLTTPGIGDALWPIYAMAKGMHEVFTASRRGGSYERIDPMDFNHKVQGSLDPNEVARRIQWDGAEHQVTRKVNWLKEWIRGGVNPDGTPMDQATNEELGKLVKYITGNTGLLPGRDITVNVQAGELERRGHRAVRVYKPVPKAHTCFSSIEVSPEPCGSEEYNDRTKEGLIKCLREIACEHTDYGMA